MSRTLSFSTVFVCLLASAPALAAPSWLDPYGKVEAGVAFPLTSPQSDFFAPGFGGRLNLGLGLGEWFAVQATGQLVALPARSSAPSTDPAVPIGVGGGFRLKLPYRYVVSPWVDADALYVRTGPLDRLGFTVGAGFHVPLGAKRMWRVGPFARYFQILDSDAAHVDSSDAKMLIVGVSLEVGKGITRDSDGDGVEDEADECPNDAGPKTTHGCPDRDNDNIADKNDRCPDQAGPLSTGGCPDRDHDGLVDNVDKCPDEAGPEATGGCPDKDGDLITDKEDKCPNEPGPAATGGCPDKDGDLIADKDDKCPNDRGPAATHGCPDRDNDGVPDAEDKCPDQAGPSEREGCPVSTAKVEVTAKKLDLNEKIYFDTGSSKILPRSYAILDAVVSILKEKSDLKIRIEGHTDNVKPTNMDNKQLSEYRAGAVKEYLVTHGVEAKRLRPKGWGESKPIDKNDTEEGREKNRRVEFVIIK